MEWITSMLKALLDQYDNIEATHYFRVKELYEARGFTLNSSLESFEKAFDFDLKKESPPSLKIPFFFNGDVIEISGITSGTKSSWSIDTSRGSFSHIAKYRDIIKNIKEIYPNEKSAFRFRLISSGKNRNDYEKYLDQFGFNDIEFLIQGLSVWWPQSLKFATSLLKNREFEDNNDIFGIKLYYTNSLTYILQAEKLMGLELVPEQEELVRRLTKNHATHLFKKYSKSASNLYNVMKKKENLDQVFLYNLSKIF